MIMNHFSITYILPKAQREFALSTRKSHGPRENFYRELVFPKRKFLTYNPQWGQDGWPAREWSTVKDHYRKMGRHI